MMTCYRCGSSIPVWSKHCSRCGALTNKAEYLRDEKRRIQTGLLRELVKSSFDDEGFTIFCYDYFSPVYEMFSVGMGRLWKIQLLIDYCERQGKFEKLVELVKEMNPYQYSKFVRETEDIREDIDNIATNLDAPKTQLEVVIPGKLEDFTADKQCSFIRAVAGELNIPTEQIKLLGVFSGSVIFRFEVSRDVGERLFLLYRDQSAVIFDLGIKEVKLIVGKYTRRFSMMRYTIVLGVLVGLIAFGIQAFVGRFGTNPFGETKPTVQTLILRPYSVDLEVIVPASADVRSAFEAAYLASAIAEYGPGTRINSNAPLNFVDGNPREIGQETGGTLYRGTMSGYILVPA